MRLLHSLPAQLRSSFSGILTMIVVSMCFIGTVLFFHFHEGVKISGLTRDPISIFGCSCYVGFLSQAGIFFWAASISVCFFSGYVLSRDSGNDHFKKFFFAFGILSLILGMDDAFIFHENLFPHVIGIPQNYVYFGYATITLFIIVKFYSAIMNTEWIMLGMALILFGISIAVDAYLTINNLESVDIFFLFEDGAKFAGIVSWFIYLFRTGVSKVLTSGVATDTG